MLEPAAMSFTLGLDYGTNSARCVVVDVADGREVASAVAAYPSYDGGVLSDPRDPHLARQHPGDYVVALEQAVDAALAAADRDGRFARAEVIGIGVDGTGSTPLPVDAAARPLALDERWRAHPAAQAWLWKDHTAADEAAEITAAARERRPAYVAKCGGTYSSEWWWSKILKCARTAPEVFAAAHSWVELTDYVPAVLAGVTRPEDIRRTVCCAGHKAMYHPAWGGLPDAEFLASLDPRLAELRGRLYERVQTADQPAGGLSESWARRFGLREGLAIATGLMDVHYGAIGSGVREGVLVKAIGTSTCDCAVGRPETVTRDVPGICGMVPGAILPGMVGIEAGQSAVGDIFRWWVEVVCEGDAGLHRTLEAEAAAAAPGASGLLALDWNNGNRTILVDPHLTGLVVGQTLHTTRAEIYRALIEATAFGARAIVERLREYGVPVETIVCCGGIAEKNALLMQVTSDVLRCELRLPESSQACALGAAMGGAVAAGPEAGGHADFAVAQARMTRWRPAVYRPDPGRAAAYDRLYALYRRLHDAFGGIDRQADLGGVMKELLRLQKSARSAGA